MLRILRLDSECEGILGIDRGCWRQLDMYEELYILPHHGISRCWSLLDIYEELYICTILQMHL